MKTKKTALLVGTNFSEKISEVAESLNELKQLSDTAGFSPIDTIIQRIKKPNPRFFVGCGKVEEIKRTCEENSVSTVIFDNELNPTQQRNLEQNIPAKIIDRTQLILDIFAQRAHTQEAKLQVELARNYYQLPRLTQREKFLAQQVGNIGVRAGFGEKKLEVDRRQIRDKISYLKKEIEKIKSYRELRRAKRQDVPVPVVSLVGYTNVGKSTLLNYLTKKNSVYADDKLFATLDATTRKVKLPDGKSVLFTDTVGFIKKLPHQLVAAFKSTLEEIVESNLIVHLIDITDENYNEKAKIVINVLKEIGAEKIPIITVYNKCDLLKTKKWG
ncbi:MAG: GTPase HflX, partial [Elusimicrobiota bacterium]